MDQVYRTISFEEIFHNEEIGAYIEKANENLGVIGYTEHGKAHAKLVADCAERILKELGFEERICELAKIAGYMHDIGNVVNRVDHAQSGAIMAFTILTNLHMDPLEVAQIIAAIGNHDESTAAAINPIAAALILSDKGDVRRTRVRDKKTVSGDIHDRVNFAVQDARIEIFPDRKSAVLNIKIDTQVCPVMEYFEIFLERMVLCRKAAEFLGLQFELVINSVRLL